MKKSIHQVLDSFRKSVSVWFVPADDSSTHHTPPSRCAVSPHHFPSGSSRSHGTWRDQVKLLYEHVADLEDLYHLYKYFFGQQTAPQVWMSSEPHSQSSASQLFLHFHLYQQRPNKSVVFLADELTCRGR